MRDVASARKRRASPTIAVPPRWAESIPQDARRTAARALSRSIREAHALHPGCWTVTLGRGIVRLNVGVPLALTLTGDECQLIMEDSRAVIIRNVYHAIPRLSQAGVPAPNV